MSVVVVASFFLFGTFSFFVNNVDNLPTAFNWPFSPQKLYPFPDVQGNELLLYGVLGRPRTGLFRLARSGARLCGAGRFFERRLM